jgi:hypothetical protein
MNGCISTSKLTYDLLVKQGMKMTYDAYTSLRKPKSNAIKGKIIIVKNLQDYMEEHISCSVGICPFNIKKETFVHCVSPECKKNPHHAYPSKYRNTYWCPVCCIHSKSEYRCAETCNNCTEHGSECILFEGDISCKFKKCTKDPHHHSQLKKYCRICDKCQSCHRIDMDEYLINILSFSIPDALTKMICEYYLEIDETNDFDKIFCKKCNRCKIGKHCEHCDLHHETAKTIFCKKCNKCITGEHCDNCDIHHENYINALFCKNIYS